MITQLTKPVRLVTLLALLFVINNGCYYNSKMSKKLFEKAKTQQFDVIVVPGIPYEQGGWGRTMKGRVYWSKYLYDKGIARNIIYSGAAVYTPYYEAMIMAMYANSIGIPNTNIFTETRAEHSTENIYYSYQLAKKLGFKKVALASDPFQTRMLRKFIRKRVSPDIVVIPFVVDTLKMLEPNMINPVIDTAKAFKPQFVSITERETFWKRFRGTLGKNIK